MQTADTCASLAHSPLSHRASQVSCPFQENVVSLQGKKHRLIIIPGQRGMSLALRGKWHYSTRTWTQAAVTWDLFIQRMQGTATRRYACPTIITLVTKKGMSKIWSREQVLNGEHSCDTWTTGCSWCPRQTLAESEILRNLKLTSFGRVGSLGFSTLISLINIRENRSHSHGATARQNVSMFMHILGQSSSRNTLRQSNMADNRKRSRVSWKNHQQQLGKIPANRVGLPSSSPAVLGKQRILAEPLVITHLLSPAATAKMLVGRFLGCQSVEESHWFIALGNPMVNPVQGFSLHEFLFMDRAHLLLQDSINCHLCIPRSKKVWLFAQNGVAGNALKLLL